MPLRIHSLTDWLGFMIGILASQRTFVVVNGVGYMFNLWPIDTPVVADQVKIMWGLLISTIHFK